MTVFGIGTLELVLILLLLILIFGPERITEIAKWLGQGYRKLTGVTNEINQQVSQVRKAMNTAVDTDSLTNPLRDLTKEINETQKELAQEIDNAQQEMKGIQDELDTNVIAAPDAVPEAAPGEAPKDSQETKEAQA